MGNGGGSKELWDAILFAVVWVVWTARNEAIFQGTTTNLSDLQENVKLLATRWLLAHYSTEVPSQYFINGNFALIDVPRKVTRVFREPGSHLLWGGAKSTWTGGHSGNQARRVLGLLFEIRG